MSVSVSTMPFLKPHFHDNAGSPATGYKLYSYDSTTQDTIPIYKDPAGTVEYPNPLTLNSRGEPDGMGLYLDDNKTYKLVLKTESDVTVWTVNAVHGVSEGSGSVPVINLPGHTVLGNSGDNYAIAEAVEIVSTISPTTDGDLVASVESVRTALDGYLPNSGNNTYNGDLTIGGTVDATTIKIDGVSLEDKFMGKEDHTARTLLGNKEGTAGQLQDIPLVNSLSSGSADKVPSVSAVKAGIQDAVDDITQEISNIGDVNKVSVNGSDAAGYLANKITVGDGLAIEDIGGTLQISMNMDESAQQQCFSISAGHGGALGYFVSLTELVDLSGQYNGTDYDTNYTIPFTRPSYEPNIDTANFIDTTYNRVMFNRTGKWLLIGEMSLAPKLHTVWSKQEVGLALVINGGGKEVYTAPIDLREKAAQFAYGTYTTYEITAIVDVVAGDTAQFTVNEPNLQCFFKFHGVELSSVSANTIFPDSKRIVYVSNNGSDINDGQTPNKPLATFNAAYNKAKSYQVEEGNTSIWTVVCGDTSVFLEDGLCIPPSISVNMPLAVLNTKTYLAIPESTNFTCDKVIAGMAYTTEQGKSVPTNITINTLDLTGSSDWGLITTGTSSTLVNFKIGKITLTTSDWSGCGVIGAVTGSSSSKTLNIDVGSIIFAGTVTSKNTSVGMIVWNSSECTVNARVGTVSAHNAKALLCVTNTSFVDLSVGKSDTTAMIYCPGNGTINLKGGNISGVLGSYAGAPVLNVSGFYSVAGPFVNTNSDQNIVATINLDHFGKISIGGSDIPGYLKEKVVAGDHVTITETDGTLVISSEAGGDSDTYQVKLDASDIADYLPGKILAQGAVEINTVALSGDEKQLQIVGTGKVRSDVNDVDYDYLAGKLKAGENVSIAVVDDAGVRKVEITADGSVSSLEDLTDVDVETLTKANGQVIVFNETTQMWENVDSSIIYLTEPVEQGQVLSYDATNNWWTNTTISAGVTPAGVSGDFQVNNGVGGLAASPHNFVSTQDSSLTSWKINRMLFKTPAADTKTTGISRISYLNASQLRIWASNTGSSSIVICSSDLPTHTMYAIFAPDYTHIRQLSTTWQVSNVNVDDYRSSGIVTGGSIINFTGSTVTSSNVVLTSLVTSDDAVYANMTVKMVNHSVATLFFYGYSILPNTTCDFLWLGNGGVGNTTFTLLGRYSNV